MVPLSFKLGSYHVPYFCAKTALILEKCHGMIGEHLNNVTNGRLPLHFFKCINHSFVVNFFSSPNPLNSAFSHKDTTRKRDVKFTFWKIVK